MLKKIVNLINLGKVDTVQAFIDKKLNDKKNALNASSGKKKIAKK